MATTFLDYKNDKGFYIHETYVQLIFQFVYQELLKSKYILTNKNEILGDLEDVINGYRNGYIILGWEDELVGQTDEETMVQVLENIIEGLQHKGKYIPVSEIQAMSSEDRHWKAVMDRNFPTTELIRIFTAMIQMLQGTWTSDNYDMKINWT